MRYVVFFLLFSSVLSAQQEQWTVYNTENSALPSNQINAVTLQDSLVWAGTPLGLARFNGAQWAVYNTVNSPLPGNYIKCLFASSTALWIGSTGGATSYTADQWTSYSSSNSALPSNDIRAIAEWNGALWFATPQGLASFNGTDWKVYTTDNSAIPSNNILSLSAGDGVLWVGTDGGGLGRFNGSVWTTFTSANSPLPLNTIISLAFVGNDELYIGTWDSKGLAILRTSTMAWRVLTPLANGLPDGSIRSLAAARCGYAWVGTRLGGLTDNRSAFQTLYTNQLSGIPNNYVLSLAPHSEDVWVGTENGLAFLDKIKRIHIATPQSFCQDENATISFAVDGIEPCSGTFTVELSDATGNFDAPIPLATATAAYPFVLPITIPATTEPGAAYRIRMVLADTEVGGTSASFAVHPLPTPVISQQQVIHLCGDESITLDAGDFASYRWSTGSTERTLTVRDAGTYLVTVTNTQGCSAQSPSVRVETHERPQPTVVPFGTIPMCIGDSVQITTEQYAHYQWSNGATTQTITVKEGGVYNVVVSDAFGCSAQSTSIVVSTYPQPPAPVISNINNTLYSSPALGYQWARNGTAIPDATDRVYKPLQSGSYTVTIRDENFCRATSPAYSITIVDVEEHHPTALPPFALRYNREDNSYVLTGTLAAPVAARIAVVDVLGRVVFTTTTEQQSAFALPLALHAAPRGLYMVVVQIAEQRVALPLLVQ